MTKKDGFIKYKRALPACETANKRVKHFEEFVLDAGEPHIMEQSARCMDCGVPFCHKACPLGNKIPHFNDAVFRKSWKEAYEILASTNNFPEFTGRICPAPCEGSCVLGINNDPVTIEYIEKSIAEMAFEKGWIKVNKPRKESGKSVAVIGSGPAGLACADQLRAAGHNVTVYEKADRIGGLLRYGIPDFKLAKKVVARRVDLLRQAGIAFKTNQNIGVDIDPQQLMADYDAVVLCIGSRKPRDLNIEGRSLKGIHFAMEFLTKANQSVAGDAVDLMDCKGKNVLVIGGGDTGSDCIGTSNRLGAKSVIQLELLTKPPTERAADNPWPNWPMILRTTSSHEEGVEREWCIATKRFLSADGVHLSGVETVEVRWEKGANGRYQMLEIPDSKRVIECDLAFLAIGFVHPFLEGSLARLPLTLDRRKNIKTNCYHTTVDNLFAAGDARMGQSLVVHAIAEGRKVAESVDAFLKGAEVVKEEELDVNPFWV